ncbi:MAG TPA: protocatechuate 3,4-dioxygenase subunit alpha [Amycolatopsis sp.]|nr:protocatechuate 3,4-dioxygenase subunit alpha [Amycolatopsis sp.]
MSDLLPTPSQTVGPYLSIALPWEDGPFVVPEGTEGAFWIRGTVTDGAGAVVPDALIETWQADPKGGFDHPDDPRGRGESGFRAFGRCPTDENGEFRILTVLPGVVPGERGDQARHLDVSVFSRGLLNRVITRIYFEDQDNSGDAVLASVPAERRDTLVAKKTEDGYRFDVRLQGENETVFLSL